MRPHVVHWLEQYLRADLANALAPSWFTCIGLAGLVSLVIMLVLARRRGLDTGTIASAVLWGYVAAVVAGIVMPMMIETIEHLFATGRVQLRWAGMTSFWGYLAGAAAVTAVCKRDGLPLGRMADLAAIPMGVALVFARLGCFMAGCDYGKVSALPWAMRFPTGSPAWHDHLRAGLIPAGRAESLAVQPTQLYEAMLGFVIVVVAWIVSRRSRSEGRVFLAAAATYAIGRLLIETQRGDAGRGIYAGLSSGQIFSLLVLAAIAARYVVSKRRLATAVATASLVLAVANAGEADAEPARAGAHARPKHDTVPSRTPVSLSMRGVRATHDAHVTTADGEGTPGHDAHLRSADDPGAATVAADAADAPPSDPDPNAGAIDPGATPDAPIPNAPYPTEFDAPETQAPAEPMEPVRPLRPIFAVGLLFGGATPLNRSGEQVPDLAGAGVSFGYIPGRFGAWLDVDHHANAYASHDTVLGSVSFAPRLTPRLWAGARAGLGVTQVTFRDPMFSGVTAKTFRIEAITEYVIAHNWALWVRPLTIDVVDSAALGGAITTYQFSGGVAYRFGERRRAPAGPPPPPDPPAPPPAPYPSLDGGR